MKQPDSQSKLPVPVTPPKLINHGFNWIGNRRSFLKTRKSSGVSSILMAPVFTLEFLFLALLIGILLLVFALYVMFNLLISLPRLKKAIEEDTKLL
jgi:predicted membrane protein